MKLRKWSQFPTSEAGAKRVREPREIQQEVCIYAHKEQKELEATVHPVTLALMGQPSQELLDYLGGGDDDRDKIKEEIKSGVFEFKMNGSIKVPNPKWSPEDDKPPPMKRLKTEKFLSLVPVSAMEKMAIRASIYRHTSLQVRPPPHFFSYCQNYKEYPTASLI